jgi:hypothetical protein
MMKLPIIITILCLSLYSCQLGVDESGAIKRAQDSIRADSIMSDQIMRALWEQYAEDSIAFFTKTDTVPTEGN